MNVRRIRRAVSSAALAAAFASDAWAAAGDVGPLPTPDGAVDVGDAAAALAMAAGGATPNSDANVAPPMGRIDEADGRVILEYAVGARPMPADPPSASYLFYQASLHAVDPSAPDAPLLVDASGVQAQDVFAAAGVLTGAFDASLGAPTIARPELGWVFYARADGTLRRADSHATAEGGPTPVRVSAEGGGTRVCETLQGQDFAEPLNTRVAYETAGPDGDCGSTADNAWRVVRLDMSAAEAPIPIPAKPVAALLDPSTGAHAGWLIVSAGELRRYGPDLDASVKLVNVFSLAQAIGFTLRGKVFLNVDGGLRIYDVAAGTLTSQLRRFNFPLYGVLSPIKRETDAERLYYTDSSPFRLMMVDEAGTVTMLHQPLDASGLQWGPVSSIVSAADRVVFSYLINGATKLVSVTRAGNDTNPIVLDVGNLVVASNDAGIGIGVGPGGYVYYNRVGEAPDRIDAVAVRAGDPDDRATYPQAAWAAFNFAAPLDRLGTFRPARRAFLIDGLTSLAAMQGASVRSFDAANPHSPLATLGNVPGDVAALAMLGGYRSARLGLGLPPGVDESGDVFFFDADRPDSLARVTSTPSIGEVPAGQY